MTNVEAPADDRTHDEYCLAPKFNLSTCTCTEYGFPYLPDAPDLPPEAEAADNGP